MPQHDLDDASMVDDGFVLEGHQCKLNASSAMEFWCWRDAWRPSGFAAAIQQGKLAPRLTSLIPVSTGFPYRQYIPGQHGFDGTLGRAGVA